MVSFVILTAVVVGSFPVAPCSRTYVFYSFASGSALTLTMPNFNLPIIFIVTGPCGPRPLSMARPSSNDRLG